MVPLGLAVFFRRRAVEKIHKAAQKSSGGPGDRGISKKALKKIFTKERRV